VTSAARRKHAVGTNAPTPGARSALMSICASA
jgi:hypothetical protein